jgi:DNA-binding NarL/FixJ family response regulator
VLRWGARLGNQQWRIVRDRAGGYSDAAIADRVHLSVEVVRQRYRDAIDTILAAARAGGSA